MRYRPEIGAAFELEEATVEMEWDGAPYAVEHVKFRQETVIEFRLGFCGADMALRYEQ